VSVRVGGFISTRKY